MCRLVAARKRIKVSTVPNGGSKKGYRGERGKNQSERYNPVNYQGKSLQREKRGGGNLLKLKRRRTIKKKAVVSTGPGTGKGLASQKKSKTVGSTWTGHS